MSTLKLSFSIGEYEETIARSWYRSANFRVFFTKVTCPQPIQQCLSLFETLIRPQVRDTLVTDALLLREESPEESSINEDNSFGPVSDEPIQDKVRTAFIAQLPPGTFIPPTIETTSILRHRGISYGIRSKHEGNSGVFLNNDTVPVCIEKIIQFPSTSTAHVPEGAWLVVKPHRRAIVDYDPFLSFPRLRASMWSTQLMSTLKVVPVSAIDTHFAKCTIPWEGKDVAVVVSLSRVSQPYAQM